VREKRVKKYVNGKKEKKPISICNKTIEADELNGPLGWFYKVTVDRSEKTVNCNCEVFNTWACCIHSSLFNLIECNTVPDMRMRNSDGSNWTKIVENLRSTVFLKTLFDDSVRQEDEYNKSYIAFFPPPFYDDLDIA
jgi:hypothetical protein